MAPADRRTQIMLAGKLRLNQGKGSDERSAQNNFLSLFDKQLSKDHIVALAALFKITVPENPLPCVAGLVETVLAPTTQSAT